MYLTEEVIMDKSLIREEARMYFVPILLGDNQESHRISRKIFKKYGISSFVLDNKRIFADLWDFSCRFVKLSSSDGFPIIFTQLVDITREIPSALPILIPCSSKYESFTKLYRNELEAFFVISDKELIFTASPLKIIPS